MDGNIRQKPLQPKNLLYRPLKHTAFYTDFQARRAEFLRLLIHQAFWESGYILW